MKAAGIVAPEIDRMEREASDAELVAAVRAGDDSAFAELYRRHQPSVARFVRGRIRDHGRAEDVVQEAFVSALRRMRQTDSELAFRAWIFEIARNASIDFYRRSSRVEEVSMDAVGGLGPADASRLGGASGPDASLVLKENFNHFRGALEELSETHHRIIVMRELEGRSYREIGDRMHLSQAAVESTLFRARRKLEHEYEQLDSGRRCRLVGATIGRLAEGLDSRLDRIRLDRHARRCSACRRQARQLGVEPLLGARGVAARAAAFLPLPAVLRRRLSSPGDASVGTGLSHSAGHLGAAFAPSIEVAGAMAGKAVALVAAVALIGGGGATLGGAGPLAVGGQDTVTDQRDSGVTEPAPAVKGSAQRGELSSRGDPAARTKRAARAASRFGPAAGSPTDDRPGAFATPRGIPGTPAAPAAPRPAPTPWSLGEQPSEPAMGLDPVGDRPGGGSDHEGSTILLHVKVGPEAGPVRDTLQSPKIRVRAPDLDLTPSEGDLDPAGYVDASLPNTSGL